jgi:hypothetical protein
VGEGERGEWERGRGGELPNYQFPISNSLNIHPLNPLNPDSMRVAELPSRIKFQKEREFACEF